MAYTWEIKVTQKGTGGVEAWSEKRTSEIKPGRGMRIDVTDRKNNSVHKAEITSFSFAPPRDDNTTFLGTYGVDAELI